MVTCSSCSLLYNDVCIYASLNQNITIYIYIYIYTEITQDAHICRYAPVGVGPPGTGPHGAGEERGGDSPVSPRRDTLAEGRARPYGRAGPLPPRPPPRGRRPVRPGTQGTRGGPSTTHHPESKHAELLIPQPLLSCSFQQLSMAWN